MSDSEDEASRDTGKQLKIVIVGDGASGKVFSKKDEDQFIMINNIKKKTLII